MAEAEQALSEKTGGSAAAEAVLDGESRRSGIRRVLPFLGPAFVASVAYVDPGNFATNIQAGAAYGYLLLWVVVASNLMAMLIQTMSAKLGIATGLNLAEHCRRSLPRPLVWIMWIAAEIVAMATDLAEFLGASLGLYLLFHIPLMWGAILTAILTMLILSLQRLGFRPLEMVITGFVGVIALCYVVELVLGHPRWSDLASHALVPRFAGRESMVLAAGILGATVMPHVIFLHSALTQGRVLARNEGQLRRLFHFEVMDVVLALSIAGFVNAAMLVTAAAAFHEAGLTAIASIEEAHRTLRPLLGAASSWIFAVSLLASGISSSVVGTMSGQVIMQGFLHFATPLWLRRFITMLPSLVVIALGLDPTRALVISQVVLSFGIPFALVPLIIFTASRKIMGPLANRTITTVLAGLAAVLILSLNALIIWQTLG